MILSIPVFVLKQLMFPKFMKQKDQQLPLLYKFKIIFSYGVYDISGRPSYNRLIFPLDIVTSHVIHQ